MRAIVYAMLLSVLWPAVTVADVLMDPPSVQYQSNVEVSWTVFPSPTNGWKTMRRWAYFSVLTDSLNECKEARRNVLDHTDLIGPMFGLFKAAATATPCQAVAVFTDEHIDELVSLIDSVCSGEE